MTACPTPLDAAQDWEGPPRPAPDPHAAPVLSIDGFEGPLDWLLAMARARRIDLARLSILDLVSAFETALLTALAAARGMETARAAPALALARWGDWLVMAAELAWLRSRLLAASAAEAKAALLQAEALRRQVMDRAVVMAAADWLDRRVQLGRDVFPRGLAPEARATSRAAGGDVVGLLRACLVALAVPADAGQALQLPAPPVWSVAQATARIRSLLPELGAEGGALAVFLPAIPQDEPQRGMRCRAAVASTFLAGLELAREGDVELVQDSAQQPVLVRVATRLNAGGAHAG